MSLVTLLAVRNTPATEPTPTLPTLPPTQPVPAAQPAQATSSDPPPKVLPPAPERDLVARVCTGCHVPEMLVAKRHTAAEWDDIIARMIDHGAQASDVEQDQILTYLVRFYGKPVGP
jgi:cytochrome c5